MYQEAEKLHLKHKKHFPVFSQLSEKNFKIIFIGFTVEKVSNFVLKRFTVIIF